MHPEAQLPATPARGAPARSRMGLCAAAWWLRGETRLQVWGRAVPGWGRASAASGAAGWSVPYAGAGPPERQGPTGGPHPAHGCAGTRCSSVGLTQRNENEPLTAEDEPLDPGARAAREAARVQRRTHQPHQPGAGICAASSAGRHSPIHGSMQAVSDSLARPQHWPQHGEAPAPEMERPRSAEAKALCQQSNICQASLCPMRRL